MFWNQYNLWSIVPVQFHTLSNKEEPLLPQGLVFTRCLSSCRRYLVRLKAQNTLDFFKGDFLQKMCILLRHRLCRWCHDLRKLA